MTRLAKIKRDSVKVFYTSIKLADIHQVKILKTGFWPRLGQAILTSLGWFIPLVIASNIMVSILAYSKENYDRFRDIFSLLNTLHLLLTITLIILTFYRNIFGKRYNLLVILKNGKQKILITNQSTKVITDVENLIEENLGAAIVNPPSTN